MLLRNWARRNRWWQTGVVGLIWKEVSVNELWQTDSVTQHYSSKDTLEELFVERKQAMDSTVLASNSFDTTVWTTNQFRHFLPAQRSDYINIFTAGLRWLPKGWVWSYFLLCELRLSAWWEMSKCISYMLRNGSWLSHLWTKQLTTVNKKIQGKRKLLCDTFPDIKALWSETKPAAQTHKRTNS